MTEIIEDNISLIKVSELETTLRIDPEYYYPTYLKLEKEIFSKIPHKLWQNLGGVFITGPFGSEFNVENYVSNGSYRYVRGKDVKEFFLVDTDNVYISEGDFERLKKFALKEGDILISVVGTLGNVAIVDKNNIPAIFSCKSTAYRTKDINPHYLLTYLNCKFGRMLLNRKIRGTVQTGLNVDDLKSLPIFFTSNKLQKEIVNLVLMAKEEYDSSKLFYMQAEELLLKTLRLKDFEFKHDFFYTSTLSNVFKVNRLDAEYFNPVYDKIEQMLITNFDSKPIGKLKFIDVTTGQYSEEYAEKPNGKPYIRGTDIKYGSIDMDDLVYIAPENQIESKRAKEGDVVVTRVGSIGLSARIPKECDGGTISDNLIRLRFNEERLNSFYLTVFLGSSIGIGLMIRNSRGSVQQRLNQETLKEIVVPLLPSKTQQKIASFVRRSQEARMKAKELLEEAKRKIEVEIEKHRL